MPVISRDYWAHSGNYTPGGNSCEYIVLHMTGNTAPALNEAKYAQNNRHDSSYHYVLDGGGVIYQTLWDSDTAWSVGAWKGATQYIRNNQTINIEVCNNGGPYTSAEIEELRWLVLQLMAKWGIDKDHIVRHWDCHSGHKSCPSWYSGYNNTAWEDLVDYITTKEEDMNFKVSAPNTVAVGEAVNYRVIPDTKYNYAWAEGEGWDNWGSTLKDTGSYTGANSGVFKQDKPGTYRLWVDVVGDDGNITSAQHYITVVDEPDEEGGTEPSPVPIEIDYEKLATLVANKVSASIAEKVADVIAKRMVE